MEEYFVTCFSKILDKSRDGRNGSFKISSQRRRANQTRDAPSESRRPLSASGEWRHQITHSGKDEIWVSIEGYREGAREGNPGRQSSFSTSLVQ